MELNADFSKPALIHSAELDWQPSPMPGVERRMLDRIGGEKARATSIVRYAPDSEFLAHVHKGGEELFVLEGVFQDEQGDFPAGSYVRNPPGSIHVPRSEPGCIIFVKLWQFAPTDLTPVHVDTERVSAIASVGQSGPKIKPLFSNSQEDVRLEIYLPGQRIRVKETGGIELLVLDGSLQLSSGETLERWSWLRLPPGVGLGAIAGTTGCTFWIKTGHLVPAFLEKTLQALSDSSEAVG